MLRVQALDHIVLNVADVECSIAFYHGVLGLAIEREDEWRAGTIRFPSVRLTDATIIDLFGAGEVAREDRVQNLNHLCLVVDDEILEPIVDHLTGHGVETHRGPARRWGAKGDGVSVYFNDPDGNEIEVRTYSPVALERAPGRTAAAAR
jgi:catechol 2,3-dioxygenase-like lactoylglutathione lyase family enzyme